CAVDIQGILDAAESTPEAGNLFEAVDLGLQLETLFENLFRGAHVAAEDEPPVDEALRLIGMSAVRIPPDEADSVFNGEACFACLLQSLGQCLLPGLTVQFGYTYLVPDQMQACSQRLSGKRFSAFESLGSDGLHRKH